MKQIDGQAVQMCGGCVFTGRARNFYPILINLEMLSLGQRESLFYYEVRW